MKELGREFENDTWLDASEHYDEGAGIITEITDIIVSYLTGEYDRSDELPKLFTKVMGIMEKGLALSVVAE